MSRINDLNEPISTLDPATIHPSQCNRLWAAVIARAFADADWSPDDKAAKKITPDLYQELFNDRASALVWLRGNTEAFGDVCDAAHANPEYVRRIARSRYGKLIDKCWTPIPLSEAIRRNGVGSKPQMETVT
jgi:hypothetical protein